MACSLVLVLLVACSGPTKKQKKPCNCIGQVDKTTVLKTNLDAMYVIRDQIELEDIDISNHTKSDEIQAEDVDQVELSNEMDTKSQLKEKSLYEQLRKGIL